MISSEYLRLTQPGHQQHMYGAGKPRLDYIAISLVSRFGVDPLVGFIFGTARCPSLRFLPYGTSQYLMHICLIILCGGVRCNESPWSDATDRRNRDTSETSDPSAHCAKARSLGI